MSNLSIGQADRQLSYLFVVSYGRSATTLLQGALNQSPNIHCSGENGNFLLHLYEAKRALSEAAQTAKLLPQQDQPTQPFFGITSSPPANHPELYRELVRSLCLASCPKNKTPAFVGFKEIRYPWVKDLTGYLNWMDAVFLSPKFILVTRELKDVVNSGMYGSLSGAQKKQLFARFESFEATTRSFISRSVNRTELTFGQIRSNAYGSAEALNKIGLPVSKEHFLAAQAVKHSF